MNREDREYTERRTLSKLRPWHSERQSEDKEVWTEEAPKKNLEDKNTENEEND